MKRVTILSSLMLMCIHCGAAETKIRVAWDALEISEQGIFLHVEGVGQMPVGSVHRDRQGFYVEDSAFCKIWQCPKCGWLNHVDDDLACNRCRYLQPR